MNMSRKKIIALSIFLVLTWGLFHILSLTWFLILYVLLSFAAFFTGYFLTNLEEKVTLKEYAKKCYGFPQWIILLALHILLILVMLFGQKNR